MQNIFAPQEQQLTFVENDRISKYWSGSRKQFSVLKKQNQTDPITHYLFKTKLIKIKILESKKKYFDIQGVKQRQNFQTKLILQKVEKIFTERKIITKL